MEQAGAHLVALWVLGGVALVALRWRGRARWNPTTWALRVGFLICVGLAAGGLRARGFGDARGRVLVVDGSRSLTRGERVVARLALASLADLPDDAPVALIRFGRYPVVALGWTTAAAARERLPAALTASVEPWGSDLGAALDLAADLIRRRGEPADVLLISDGRDTAGGARRASAALDVPLHALAPDAPPAAGARLTRLDAPARVAADQPAQVTVEATALSAGELRLRLRSGDHELPAVTRAAQAGEAVVARWITPPLPAGSTTLRARVDLAGDDAPEDDALSAVVLSGDARRILRVGPRLGIGAASTSVDELREQLGDPPELLVLHEQRAHALAPLVGALRAAVRAGMGLAVVGASRAFGPGGYGDSPLEGLLPVTCGPGQERERSLLLSVAIDGSGSMDGEGQSPYLQAVESSLPTELLRAGDRLAVVRFADAATLVQPLGPVAADLRARLEAHAPRGGTDVGAGLALALEALASADEGERRLILATDSQDPDPRRHGARLRVLADRLAGEDAHALLIQVGPEAPRALEELAGLLRPALRVEVQRAASAGDDLRELVRGELLAGRAEVRRGRFPLTLSESARARGLTAPSTVSAFAPVRPRTDPEVAAEVLANVSDAETQDPPAAVLGRLGLGRTLALPLSGGEAADLLRGLVPVLLPPRGEATLRTQRRGGWVDVEVEAAAPLPSPATLRLIGGAGEEAQGSCAAITPRRLQGSVRAPDGDLRALLVGPRGELLAAASVPDSADAELASPGPDQLLLSELCELSGGELLAAPPSADRPLPPPASGRGTPIAPLAALLALALLVLDAAAATLKARFGGRRLPRAEETVQLG